MLLSKLLVNNHLRALDLSHNDIQDAATEIARKAAEFPTFNYINFTNNNLKPNQLDCIVELEQLWAARGGEWAGITITAKYSVGNSLDAKQWRRVGAGILRFYRLTPGSDIEAAIVDEFVNRQRDISLGTEDWEELCRLVQQGYENESDLLDEMPYPQSFVGALDGYHAPDGNFDKVLKGGRNKTTHRILGRNMKYKGDWCVAIANGFYKYAPRLVTVDLGGNLITDQHATEISREWSSVILDTMHLEDNLISEEAKAFLWAEWQKAGKPVRKSSLKGLFL